MAVILHDDPLRFQQGTLLRPAGHKPPRMVDDSVARILAVLLRHAEHLSHQPGVFLPADQTRNLAVCGDTSLRYLFDNGKNLVYQVFARNTLPSRRKQAE